MFKIYLKTVQKVFKKFFIEFTLIINSKNFCLKYFYLRNVFCV